MQLFSEIVKMELRLYRRGIWLWLVLALLGTYLYFGYQTLVVEMKYSVGQLLASSAYIVMAGSLFGMVFGILNARREAGVKFAEALAAMPGDAVRPLAKLTAWCLVSVMMALASCAELVLIDFINTQELTMLWPMFVEYIFLYWGLTMFTAGIVGYALEMLLASYWKYILMFGLWFITSPYNGVILPPSVTAIFNQGQLDPNASYPDFFGLFTGVAAWMRHLLWLGIATALLCLGQLTRQLREKNRQEKTVLSAVTALSAVVAVASLWPVLGSNQDTRLQMRDEFLYYDEVKSTVAPVKQQKTQAAPFTVTSYRLDLTFGDDSLSYNAELTVKTQQANDWLAFTMFNGLEASVVQVDGQATEWKRDGDHLLIKWAADKREGLLQLKVTGQTGSRGPIHPNGYFLSASFPWYPMPGRSSVAEISPYNELVYNHLQLEEPAHFDVTVHGNGDVHSNLKRVGERQFSGDSRGVTLMQGLLQEQQFGNFTVVSPPDLGEGSATVIPRLQEASDAVAQKLSTDSVQIPKRIFIAPLSENSNQLMEAFDDHLVIGSKQMRAFHGSEERFLLRPSIVMMSLYWHGQYRAKETISPILLDLLFDHLYGEKPDDGKSDMQEIAENPSFSQNETGAAIQPLTQRILAVESAGRSDDVKQFLADWYAKMNAGQMDKLTLEQMVSTLEKGEKTDGTP